MSGRQLDVTGPVVALMYREAHLLDRRMWSDWLTLFTEDLVYWVPAWKSETETTAAPDRELSLIYYSSRARLEDRVWRIQSGLSPAAQPLARTCHVVANILSSEQRNGGMTVHTGWACHHFHPSTGRQDVLFGQSEYELRKVNADWKIARKRTIIDNDLLPAVVDFYHI